jgi:hypothetical protein
MNIGRHSTLKGIMQAKMYSLVKDQSKRGKDHGAWSNACILGRIAAGDLTEADCSMCKGLFFPCAMMISNLTKDYKCDRNKQYIAGPEQDKLGDHADVANRVMNLVTIHECEMQTNFTNRHALTITTFQFLSGVQIRVFSIRVVCDFSIPFVSTVDSCFLRSRILDLSLMCVCVSSISV